ncbi:hypothetical protein Y09_1592 [Brachybacterium sp. SW0106-09]|nr:hypothetical protein Y09_1592 [Brachybacterium sp. SW0106-09]
MEALDFRVFTTRRTTSDVQPVVEGDCTSLSAVGVSGR